MTTETPSLFTVYVALTLSIQCAVILTHRRRQEPLYEFIRGSNFLILSAPLMTGVLLHILYTVFILRPIMSLRVWLFRRLLYEVLFFGCVLGGIAMATAWISVYLVFIPPCVNSLVVLLCESTVVVREMMRRRSHDTTARRNKYVFTLDEEEEEELFDDS